MNATLVGLLTGFGILILVVVVGLLYLKQRSRHTLGTTRFGVDKGELPMKNFGYVST